MFDTPWVYIIIHIILGFIAYHDKTRILTLLFITYQIAQLALNQRLFLFSMSAEKGNDMMYTLYKLLQFGIGYGIAMNLHISKIDRSS